LSIAVAFVMKVAWTTRTPRRTETNKRIRMTGECRILLGESRLQIATHLFLFSLENSACPKPFQTPLSALWHCSGTGSLRYEDLKYESSSQHWPDDKVNHDFCHE
jgi:hypothetical protein